MSPCLEIEKEPGGTGFYYKYSSILTSDELTAYTHPPRITIGGIDNSMEDVPPLRVPTNCQNKEIFIGNIVNGEKYSFESANKYGNGYVTDIKFCIGNNEMHHAFIAGGSRSGKSVLAARAAIEMYKNAPYVNKKTGTKTHKRVFVLDPKGEWREMASLVPKGKFKFYSVGKPHFHPLPLNLLRVPIGVTPYQYYNLVIEHFCSAYGLLDRAIAQIGGVLYDLYEQNDVFGHDEDPNWANEHSKNITLTDVYDQIEKKLHEAEAKHNQHDAEALQTYLTRLDMYHREHSAEYIMFCNRGGDSCDILLGEDDFTVVESNGLSEKSQRFFFILFMNAIYESALSRGSTGFYNGSYETVIILEEANSILIASGSDDTSGQASINRFNQILDKSASLGLFIWTITQKISSMPESVIANSGIIFVGRIGQKKDHDVVNGVLGFNDKMDFKVDKFYSRLAVGIFIGRVTKGMNFDE
jgi:DNA helicase HerA-like ATPase